VPAERITRRCRRSGRLVFEAVANRPVYLAIGIDCDGASPARSPRTLEPRGYDHGTCRSRHSQPGITSRRISRLYLGRQKGRYTAQLPVAACARLHRQAGLLTGEQLTTINQSIHSPRAAPILTAQSACQRAVLRPGCREFSALHDSVPAAALTADPPLLRRCAYPPRLHPRRSQQLRPAA
jgi:hypothetical protein